AHRADVSNGQGRRDQADAEGAAEHAARRRALMPFLEIRGVEKAYGETTVLRGVSLAIERGELIVLLGASGSGKSTLLRIVAGLESPSAGAVVLDGRDVTASEPKDRGAAMVFQSYALYPHMTVAENMGFALKLAGTAEAERSRRVAEAAAMLGLADLLNRL